jgi:hypothetical protein
MIVISKHNKFQHNTAPSKNTHRKKDKYREGQWTRRNEADVGGLEIMVTNLKKIKSNYDQEYIDP